MWIRTQSAEICVLIVTSSSPLSITVRFPVVEPHRLPCKVRVGAPAKQPTVLKEMVVTSVCSLFPLEESEGQGDLCVCGAALA